LDGRLEAFPTFVVQRSILGLEAYLRSAVKHEAAIRGPLNAALHAQLSRPRRGTLGT
jgi:hypothetical protein